MAGCNMEHGCADATVMMSMFRWLGQRYLQRAGGIDTLIEARVESYLPPPEVARWTITPSINEAVDAALELFESRKLTLDMTVGRFKG